MNAYIVDRKQAQETGDQRLEARGQTLFLILVIKFEARTDIILMYNLQKVEISAHLEHFEAKLFFLQKLIQRLQMKLFCQLQFVMQSGNTFVSMLRPCSFHARKFEMGNDDGRRGVLQKTSSIRKTLAPWDVCSLGCLSLIHI